MNLFKSIAGLLLAIAIGSTARADQSVVVLFPRAAGFDYEYGSWKGAVTRAGDKVAIAPPADESGGVGASASEVRFGAGAIVRVTARVGAENQTAAFNIVLKDNDPDGVEDFVYRFSVDRFSQKEFLTAEVPITTVSWLNNRKNGIPDFEDGLAGWEIQGTHEGAASIHVEISKIEIVIP